MPDMLVRNVKPETMAYLKRKAAINHRTVQDEVRELLDAAAADEERAKRLWIEQAREHRRQLEGRFHSNSKELAREGRAE